MYGVQAGLDTLGMALGYDMRPQLMIVFGIWDFGIEVMMHGLHYYEMR
jgi:hypothetical protein